jgi:hypothetical protein
MAAGPARGHAGEVTAQPLPPPPGPTGWLAITVQGSALTSNMISPIVRLNGYHVPTRYGENLVPVPPGRWHVDVHCSWMRDYGQAALDCDVAEGQTVPVFYAPPYHQFTHGDIGHTRQRRRGVLGLVLSLGLALAVVVVAILLSLI